MTQNWIEDRNVTEAVLQDEFYFLTCMGGSVY